MISGIDISRWNDVQSLALAKASGIHFCAIRATIGDYYTDPKFEEFWSRAEDACIYPTAYHVLTPDKLVGAQMDRFFSAMSGKKIYLPLVLDVELDRAMSNSIITSKTVACLDVMKENSNKTPLLYTSSGFANAHFTNAAGWINKYLMWVAHYTTLSQPRLPTGATSWTLWQYTDRGLVPGLGGSVDLDWFNGTLEQLKALADGFEFPVVIPGTVEERLSVLEREARVRGWNI